MKKYPFVKQEQQKDCGVACLSMIIRYYHGSVPIQQLRDMTHTTYEGTKAYYLLKCASTLGFQTKGLQCSVKDLENIVLPAILHVQLDGYFHYIVLYKINPLNQSAIIADPSIGIQKITYEQLQQIYQNVVLQLYPIQPLPKIKGKNYLKEIIKEMVVHYKEKIMWLFLLSFICMILSLVSTLYFVTFLEISSNYIGIVLFLFIILEFLKHTFLYLRNRIILNLRTKIETKFTSDTFQKIMKLPYIDYRKNTTGDFVSRMEDVKIVSNTIVELFFTILFDLFLLLFSSIIMFNIQTNLFLLSFSLIVIYYVFHHKYEKKYRNSIFGLQRKYDNLQSYMIEHITGMETVYGLSIEQDIIDEFEQKSQDYFYYKKQFELKQINQDRKKQIAYDVFFLFLLALGSYFIKTNVITLQEFLIFQMVFSYWITPIENIWNKRISYEEAKQASRRIMEIQPKKSQQQIPLFHLEEINLQNLTYFHEDTQIIKPIDLNIKAGQKILIIGESGSGKSTLLKILKGYYSVNNEYKINKKSSIEFKKDRVLYLSQNERLFTGSAVENITLGKNFSEDKIKEICEICEINPIVKQNHLQMHMMIEENGFNISGGERQRIALARSLLKPFELLLIDEGTSQMDHNMERRILKKIFHNWKQKTIIIVSHRIENMDLFDQVIKLEKGQIKEVLTKKEEAYA